MTLSPSQIPAGAQSGRRRLVVTIILISIGIHAAAAIVAGIVVVARYFAEAPAEFKTTKDVRIPAKKREAKMNMASLDAIAPKPTFSDKMQSSRPTAFSLPDIPNLPLDQMLPLDPSQLISDQMASLSNVEAMGSGSGAASAGAGGFGDKGMSFLGIQSSGQRILLLFDVSSSVTHKAAKAGVPLEKIQQETINLIRKLPITSKFGIIQFTQNYKPFSKELLPATDNNRTAALNWVQTEWVTKGSMSESSKVISNSQGLIGVLDLAAEMKPDVIFIISDGSFQWKAGGGSGTIPWTVVKKRITENLCKSGDCKVNFIAFEAKSDDTKEMRGISQRSGGKMIELK
jgi:hypothetical protein